MYATLTKSGDDFSQGTYELRKNMDYQAIITNLMGNSNRTDSVEVTIIEGQSVVEIANTLEKRALSATRTSSWSCATRTSLTATLTSSRIRQTKQSVTTGSRAISIPINTSSM